jgi:hypothetical protein
MIADSIWFFSEVIVAGATSCVSGPEHATVAKKINTAEKILAKLGMSRE